MSEPWGKNKIVSDMKYRVVLFNEFVRVTGKFTGYELGEKDFNMFMWNANFTWVACYQIFCFFLEYNMLNIYQTIYTNIRPIV